MFHLAYITGECCIFRRFHSQQASYNSSSPYGWLDTITNETIHILIYYLPGADLAPPPHQPMEHPQSPSNNFQQWMEKRKKKRKRKHRKNRGGRKKKGEMRGLLYLHPRSATATCRFFLYAHTHTRIIHLDTLRCARKMLYIAIVR